MADKPLKSLTFPDLTDTYTIPQKTSDLANDSGFVNASGAASAAPVQSVNGQTGDVDVNTVYIGSSAPTDPNVNVWVDTAGSSDIVVPLPASTAPLMDGTAAIGTATTYARADHVHPTDTSRLAANQGSANAGKFLVVGSDGIVAPVTMATWQGGSY